MVGFTSGAWEILLREQQDARDVRSGPPGDALNGPHVAQAGGLVNFTLSIVGFGNPIAGFAAPFIGVFAGAYGILAAREEGIAQGKYNAFIVSFAQSVSDFSRGEDRRRRNVVYADASIRGRNAAIHLLTEIGQGGRSRVFAQLRGLTDREAVQAIVRNLGGQVV